MRGAHQADRLLLARCALVLFISGLVLPLVMGMLGRSWDSGGEVLSLHASLGLVAEFFALAFGFLGRRHPSGQVGMLGALVILAGVFLFRVFS